MNASALSLPFSFPDTTTIAAVVVAGATIVYAIITWRLLVETRKMYEVQTRPIVSISIDYEQQWASLIDLKIKNIGQGAANKIKFRIEPNFLAGHQNELKNLSEFNIIKNGIHYLAPNQEIKFFLTCLVENKNFKLANPFKIIVSYEGFSGKKYDDQYVIDFSIWDELLLSENDSLYKISESLERISQNLRK